MQYQVVREGYDQYLLALGESTHGEGTVSVLQPPGDIHTVYNPGLGVAVSIHICGGDLHKLGSRVRCRYNLPVVETLPASFRRRIAAAG